MLKPLETKEMQEKRIKKRNIIFGVIIAVIMIAGTVGWALSGREKTNQEEYNGFKFIKQENYWQTSVSIYGSNFLLRTSYLPREVENITSKSRTLSLEKIYGKTLYVVLDSAIEQEPVRELALNLQNFVERIQIACSENVSEESISFCSDKPVKGCDDATLENAIIVFEEKNLTKLEYKAGCLQIQAQESDFLRASDKALFLIFGIMT
ncbi:MAG: hypothetical protein QXP53_00970 [Candidatus Pacearchaeota archaeon]